MTRPRVCEPQANIDDPSKHGHLDPFSGSTQNVSRELVPPVCTSSLELHDTQGPKGDDYTIVIRSSRLMHVP